MLRFENQVVIVTGSSQGIGEELALSFANEGARVVVNYKKSKEADTYFYTGEIKKKGKFISVKKNENPFKKLLSLNIK